MLITLARKPLDRLIVRSVLDHNTSAFNIDATRIPSELTEKERNHVYVYKPYEGVGGLKNRNAFARPIAIPPHMRYHPLGRYPGNVIVWGDDLHADIVYLKHLP